MPYRLLRSKKVLAQIERLPGHIRQRVKRVINDLAYNPRPHIAEPLRGILTGRYKIKIDDYRIVYAIDEESIAIEILKVGHKHGPEFYQDIV
ncbi:MAG: type II toxin-antitoxin system RelE/ParE family toxin [Caldilineaceae bacterium]